MRKILRPIALALPVGARKQVYERFSKQSKYEARRFWTQMGLEGAKGGVFRVPGYEKRGVEVEITAP